MFLYGEPGSHRDGEFDLGSGRTLAAYLRHASRTVILWDGSGGRVRNAWGTCLLVGDNALKDALRPHTVSMGKDREKKGLLGRGGRRKRDLRPISLLAG